MIQLDTALALLLCLQTPPEQGAADGSTDDLSTRVEKLESEVKKIRLEQVTLAAQPPPPPVVVSAPSGPSTPRYDDGLVWEDPAAPFAVRMKALLQFRYEIAKTEGVTVTDHGVWLPAARLGWDGYAFSRKLGYRFEVDYGGGQITPLDINVEVRLSPHWTLRAGQVRVPFSRSWMTREQMLLYPVRAFATDVFRYGYDIGVLVESRWFDDRVSALLGVFNGAGPNVVANDNVDPMLAARVQVALTRASVAWGEGDRARTPRPAVAVGASATADYVPPPSAYGYTSRVPLSPRPVVALDSDGNGRPDGVRVLEAELDVAVRWRGVAVDAEIYGRRETWPDIGTLQPDPQNRFVPRNEYAGLFGQLSYSFVNGAQLAGRFSVAQLSPLAVGGRQYPPETCIGPDGVAFECNLPYADRRAELSVLAAYSLWDGHAVGALMYSLLNWSATTGAGVPTPRQHDFIAQLQFAL
jgi:hypothetical protein